MAGVVTVGTVPLTILLARMTGAVAAPDTERHLHATPTPRLGGLAMALGFGAAVAVAGSSVDHRWQVISVCIGIAVAMTIDDILDLSWITKLVLAGGSGVAVAALCTTIAFVALPGDQTLELGLFAAPVTVAWVLGMETSINLIDGVDGVAAGVSAIVATVLLLAAVNRLGPGAEVQEGVIVMAGALIGCSLGFLIWNWAPARVFMGDSGSHFLGTALAVMTVVGVAKVAVALSLAVPLLALGMPIGDTVWAIVRRYRNGQGITSPDAGHIHHRLLNLGLSPREIAWTFYLTTGMLGCLSLTIFGHRRIVIVGVILLGMALATLLWRNRRRVRLGAQLITSLPARPLHPGEAE